MCRDEMSKKDLHGPLLDYYIKMKENANVKLQFHYKSAFVILM